MNTCLDTEPDHTVLTRCRRAVGITGQSRGVRGQALELRAVWEGPTGKAAAANRAREIRPSGMRGGLVETWSMAELGTHGAIERASTGHSPPTDARATFLPDEEECEREHGMMSDLPSASARGHDDMQPKTSAMANRGVERARSGGAQVAMWFSFGSEDTGWVVQRGRGRHVGSGRRAGA